MPPRKLGWPWEIKVPVLTEDGCRVSDSSAYSLSVGIGLDRRQVTGDLDVTGTRIPSPPRCQMSFSSPEHIAARSPSENCARIKKLGYIVGKHMNLYGEHLELVSDPFDEGDCVAVRAISISNPAVRTIELPVSILAGWEELFQEVANSTGSELTATAPLPGS
jgi:hypothetical protein